MCISVVLPALSRPRNRILAFFWYRPDAGDGVVGGEQVCAGHQRGARGARWRGVRGRQRGGVSGRMQPTRAECARGWRADEERPSRVCAELPISCAAPLRATSAPPLTKVAQGRVQHVPQKRHGWCGGGRTKPLLAAGANLIAGGGRWLGGWERARRLWRMLLGTQIIELGKKLPRDNCPPTFPGPSSSHPPILRAARRGRGRQGAHGRARAPDSAPEAAPTTWADKWATSP